MVRRCLNLVSLNVRGLGNNVKRTAIFRWVQKMKSDIVLLQETYTTVVSEREWNKEWSGPVFYSHGSSNSRGCAILISPNVDFKTKSVIADREGRYIILQCYINNEILNIINVYAPNNELDQVSFLENLDNAISNLSSSDDLIIGGDWNVIRDVKLDKSGGNDSVTKPRTVAKLDQLMYSFNLCDVWRIKHPNLRRFTWRKSRPELIQCRLDFWLISESMYDNVSDCDILPAIRSDHSCISLKLEEMPNENIKYNLWKFNSDLLTDLNYINQMKTNLNDWKNEYDNVDKRFKWEFFKYKIRQFSISYSKTKRKSIREKQNKLEHELIILERNLTDEDNTKKYNEIKQELQDIENKKIEGTLLRNKIEWFEKGERSTRYFLGLEKIRETEKHIRKLEFNKNIVTDPAEILKAQRNYYEKMYSECEAHDDDFNPIDLFQNVSKLNDMDKNSCEGLIKTEECNRVLLTFKTNKSPGNDGLTCEFYKHFWDDIKHVLVDSFNASYEHGELSPSQRQAVITLIHKKGKDRLKLENWRPISLLNVDYKIVSKVIANRLNQVIPKLINISQTGFINGRFMSDSVRTLYDLIEYSNIYDIEGMLLLIDFEKAFDSINWNFLFLTLNKMNFGTSFINWIRIFYTNVESCVSNKGRTSQYFPVKRGVRQGDPLSPYLFLLAMEVVTSCVINNKDIRGITVGEDELKIVQYADDTTAILKDEISLRAFLTQMNDLKTYTGLKINSSKTKAIWLGGNTKPNIKLPRDIKFTDEPVKVLGVYIGKNLIECNSKIFEEKIKNMRKIIYSWRHRKLTLTGKIIILKSLVISQINYLANLLPFPDEVIKEVDQIIYNFLWNGKTHKVKKSLIVQNFNLGGHKMIDLQAMITVQKLKWFRLYLNNHKCQWISLMENLVNVKSLSIFLRSNFDMSETFTKSSFYRECICLLHNLNNFNDRAKKKNIFNQLMYYNKYIKIGNKMIFDEDLMRAGIWKIADLLDINNKILPFELLHQRGLPQSKYMLWRGINNIINKLDIPISDINIDTTALIIDLPTGETIDIQHLTSKDTYAKIIKLKYEKPQSIKKYIITFPEIQNINLENIYLIPRMCTQDNYVKNLQFQIIHRYLPTNYLLHKMNKVPSVRCSFCELHVESIPHVFFQCVNVRHIWKWICDILERVNSCTRVTLKCQDVLFGYGFETGKWKKYVLINNVILNVKAFIWHCRKYCVKFTFANLKNWFLNKSAIDKTLESFLEKMHTYNPLI